MNERIKELIYKSYENVAFSHEPPTLVFNKEKFAELIVRECLDILEDEDTHDIYGQPIRLATIRIKKLFGVK